ncbi:SAM-dependent methyltransferase [Leptolyngbya sp. 'hensonii']|nr:SAM-dependent methyltransferase [Leptolyngbya sp. 'hensonii']
MFNPSSSNTDRRQFAPATQRNREPILQVLQRVLPPTGTVLEVASGTGEHAHFFASRLAPRFWQPSDPNPLLRESIAAWQEFEPLENLGEPLALDGCEFPWPVETGSIALPLPIQAIVNINMIHISPWDACLGLMAGADRILPAGGVLYLYGPFQRHGQHTAPSNAAFDESLQSQNPAWGVRHLEEVAAAAAARNLELEEVVEMPANNLSVVFRRQ